MTNDFVENAKYFIVTHIPMDKKSKTKFRLCTLHEITNKRINEKEPNDDERERKWNEPGKTRSHDSDYNFQCINVCVNIYIYEKKKKSRPKRKPTSIDGQ